MSLSGISLVLQEFPFGLVQSVGKGAIGCLLVARLHRLMTIPFPEAWSLLPESVLVGSEISVWTI